MNSEVTQTRTTKSPETGTIFYSAEVNLRSSCYCIEKNITKLVLKIENKELINSQAKVFDRCGTLLFYVDINCDEVLLNMQKLPGRGGVLRFENNYFIYIN